MAARKPNRITKEEIAASFVAGDHGDTYPPILDVDQAAKLLNVPKNTIYLWNSQGRLNGCSQRIGKHLRFFRDRMISKIMNDGI
jgi:excisionase family DNA binding protein